MTTVIVAVQPIPSGLGTWPCDSAPTDSTSTVVLPGTMRKVNMIDTPKSAFVPIPKGYYDLSDAEQLVICEQMALALIARLGAPDRLPSETRNQQGS